jgi:uncharacterized protein (TIGR03643 family)
LPLTNLGSYARIEAVNILPPMHIPELESAVIDRVLEMAWEDRTTFEAIEHQFGLSEKQVIAIMRREMKASSFRMWRKRVTGRGTKHLQKREFVAGRFKCQTQH